MSELYIEMDSESKTDKGTPWMTLEFIVLIDHNDPVNAEDLNFEILSYWLAKGDSFEQLSMPQVVAISDTEDKDYMDRLQEKIQAVLELSPSNEETLGHHEYGLVE